jgi:peptidoglycan/LPS O-acetylase OafA/YrhL
LYVDTMRGWAILMDIACHQALPFKHLFLPIKLLASYGQTGVFLFFVASAFTLCNSAVERRNENSPTRNFFIRRFFRIAPLYYFGILLYSSLRLLYPHLTAGLLEHQPAENLLANIFLVHGLMPAAFGGAVPGGWSIGTECAFYALFPLLFAASVKLHAKFGWAALLVPLMAAATAGAIILAHIGLANPAFWFWYDSILNQLPVFLIGVILFLTTQYGLFQPDLRRDVPAFLVVTSLAIWSLRVKLFILLPLGSAVSFVFLFNIFRATSRSYGVIERVGRASYSMYIFHFLFATFATKAVLQALPDFGLWQNAMYGAALAVTLVMTYLVGRASEKFIEHRFIEYGRLLTRPNAPVPVGA